MFTMVDEIFDRHYQASRQDLNVAILAGVRRVANAIAQAFEVLNRIEYSAPWAPRETGRHAH
jgi:hypothetical protein